MDEVHIRPLHRRGSELQRFLKLSYLIYRDDPFRVAPLMMDIKKIFTDANPFFEHAEMQLWIAERDGRDVGRIAGTIDRHYNEFHQEQTEFFGFSECVNDRAVSRALFVAATNWARRKGMDRMITPLVREEDPLCVRRSETPPPSSDTAR